MSYIPNNTENHPHFSLPGVAHDTVYTHTFTMIADVVLSVQRATTAQSGDGRNACTDERRDEGMNKRTKPNGRCDEFSRISDQLDNSLRAHASAASGNVIAETYIDVAEFHYAGGEAGVVFHGVKDGNEPPHMND